MGRGSFCEPLRCLSGNTEAASLMLKPKKEKGGKKRRGGGRLPRGKEKKRREPEKEAFCFWEEGVEGRSEGLLPKRFFSFTPHPGYSLRPGHRASTALGPLPGRDTDPSAVPRPRAGPRDRGGTRGFPAAAALCAPRAPRLRARRRRPAPTSYFRSTHPTRSGAERAGLPETCPRAGPRVTDRGRH